MKEKIKAVRKYWPQYKWRNVWSMIRNMKKPPAECHDDFAGRLAVITGATSGIGYHTAVYFASRGARLLTINRNQAKSEALCAEIRRNFKVDCNYILADLSLLNDMHRVGEMLAELDTPIDVLIHNAGIYLSHRQQTPDGLEMNFAVHFLAPFVINYLLLNKFKQDRRGRIFFVCSEAYRFAAWGLRLDDIHWKKRRYSGLKAYGAAKLAQILTMHILAPQLAPFRVTVNAMHPGMVQTNTGHQNGPLYRFFKINVLDKFSQSSELSARALYYLGSSPDLEGVTDKFFHLTTEEELAPPARDLEEAKKIWEIGLQEGRLK